MDGSWTVRHFSQANPLEEDQGNVSALLRRVASTIDELGKVEVQDIVFHGALDDDGEAWPSMTVYFYDPEDDQAAKRRP